MTNSKFIVPFLHPPKNQTAIIGNEHSLGAIELPQYGMLLAGEKAQIDAAKLITIESRDKAIAALAKSIADRIEPAGLTATQIDLMIRELQDGYDQAPIPKEIEGDAVAIESFLFSARKDFELKIESHRKALEAFMDEIIEQSKFFAKEQLRRFEVYATVIASERIPGFKNITYPELCEAFRSKELIDRIGLFGVWEDSGILYSETDYAKNDSKKVSEPLVERTEAELVK